MTLLVSATIKDRTRVIGRLVEFMKAPSVTRHYQPETKKKSRFGQYVNVLKVDRTAVYCRSDSSCRVRRRVVGSVGSDKKCHRKNRKDNRRNSPPPPSPPPFSSITHLGLEDPDSRVNSPQSSAVLHRSRIELGCYRSASTERYDRLLTSTATPRSKLYLGAEKMR